MAKILIIEDGDDSRSLMSQLIQTLGHNVTLCRNGGEGISLLKEQSFDLVITDILMPDKDGLDVLNFIRQDLPKEKTFVPVLAVSGGGYSIDKKTVLEAAKFKANCVLKKPFKVKDFNNNVRALLTGK